MLKLRRLIGLVLCCGVAGESAGAQDAVSPLSGALLRVTAPTLSTKRIVGTLVQATNGELLLDLAGSERKSVPRAAVTRLEWSRGRRGHVGKGVLWGALIGGTALAAAMWSEFETESRLQWVASTFLSGACLGALGGAGLGALIRTEDWGEVPIGNVRVTMAPVSGGVSIGLALAW